MAWPFGLRKTLLLGFLLTIGLGYSPSRLKNSVGFLVFHTPSAVWSTIKLPSPPSHTLKAAILNVTKDFDELSHLVRDFLRQPGIDPSIEKQFRAFLAERAVRSHPQLENSLDWLLALYKFAFPFLLISMIARLSGGNGAPPESPLPSPQRLERGLSRRGTLTQRQHTGEPGGPVGGSMRHRASSLRRPASPGTPQLAGNETVSFKTANSQLEGPGSSSRYGISQNGGAVIA